MSVTDEIKARLDIVDVVGQYIPLKKSGRNYKALCPFHSEKTPSFVVFPESQNWRCFGACAEGGDIFSFIMKQEGWDFPEALRHLAAMAGVEVEPPTPQQEEAREARDRLHNLLAEAALFFNAQLLNAPEADYARAYVERRGLWPDTIRSFEIGYAPPGWETTMQYLLGQGYELQDLIEGGLLVTKEDGGVYDRFRDRLVIPIRDLRGNIVGFGARALAGDATPKYLNSPQSAIFDKSRVLFGLSHARRSIRESDTAIIVEGYMDVMQAHQAGYTNVVAQMGTALTEPQLRLLSRYAGRLILALDADTAGQMATDRGREIIERVSRTAAEQAAEEGLWEFDTAERDYHARLTTEFDARGMIRYESRLGFDIRVIVLPEGLDPDDLIREMPDAWAELVEGALPIVEYVIQTTTAGQDLDDPKVKARIADQIAPLINDIANPVERSHYRQRLARLLKVEERALFADAATPTRQARAGGRVKPVQAGAEPYLPTATPTQFREAFCLATLIRYPRLVYRVNRILAECLQPDRLIRLEESEVGDYGLPTIDGLAQHVAAGDFAHPEHRSIFHAWHQALAQDEVDPLPYLLELLDPLIRQRVDAWLDRPLYAVPRGLVPPDNDLSPERIFEEAIQGLLDLRMKRLDERIQEIQFLMAEMEDGGSASAAWQNDGLTATILIAARNRIKQARDRYSMAGKRAAASESAWPQFQMNNVT
jgi:DNA primase